MVAQGVLPAWLLEVVPERICRTIQEQTGNQRESLATLAGAATLVILHGVSHAGMRSFFHGGQLRTHLL